MIVHGLMRLCMDCKSCAWIDKVVHGTWERGKTRNTPPPVDSVTTAKNLGFTSQKLVSCALVVAL